MIPFEDIAAKVIALRDEPIAVRVKLLKQSAPLIAKQLKSDCGPRGPMIFWGNSGNVDELAHAEIVDPAILIPLLHMAKQPLDAVNPHAGVQHTYGYLFSTIQTPFGKKRDRWTSTKLEDALGLESQTLSPCPPVGTLLANATWVAGQIAFRGTSRATWLNHCLQRRVSPDLHQIDWARKKTLRLIETVNAPRAARKIHLITDLVQTQPATRTEGSSLLTWLLIYSIHDERLRWPKLVTLFTVTEEFIAAIQDRAGTRKRTDIRLRYNAAVKGLPSHEHHGTVRLIRRKL